MDKLTRKAHIARAMMMGRLYDWRDGTYCIPCMDGSAPGSNCIDCETLEQRSYNAEMIAGKKWDDYKNATVQPWELPEEVTSDEENS